MLNFVYCFLFISFFCFFLISGFLFFCGLVKFFVFCNKICGGIFFVRIFCSKLVNGFLIILCKKNLFFFFDIFGINVFCYK